MRQARRQRRARRAIAATLAATTVLALAVAAQPARAATISTYKLATGLTLKKIKYPTGPVQVRVLIVNPTAVDAALNPTHSLSIDVAPASPSFPGYAAPSTIGARAGALAAVNGDFAASGRPIHPTEVDADLSTMGIQGGAGFGISRDETHAYADRVREGASVRVHATNAVWAIDRWNSGDPGPNQIAAFTKVGGTVEDPPKDSCSARLYPDGGRRWTNDRRTGISRVFVVDAQPEPCPLDPISLGSDPGAVVLAATRGGTKTDEIKSLDKGDKVTLAWGVGFDGVADEIGAMPVLLADTNGDGIGEVVAPSTCGTYFCNRNPRTGVGINQACVDGVAGCRVFMVVVDGRQPNWSVGLRLDQFAKEFKRLGAVWAVNLDGGGGTAMWVSKRNSAYCQRNTDVGCLVNRPTDVAGERKAVEALVVLPGLDADEPAVATAGGVARAERAVRTGADSTATIEAGFDARAWRLAMTDPASTGGLFDAMSRGAFGRIPPGFSERYAAVLRAYRNAVGRPKG